MGTLAKILQAHGDPVKTAEALGMPVPVVAPAPSVATLPLASPTLSPVAPVPLNVDRIASTPSAGPAIAPMKLLTSTDLPQMPAAGSSWLDWAKAHALWLLVALLVLLVIAYASQRDSKPASGFRPSRMVKGSPEARAHMASIRKRRKS